MFRDVTEGRLHGKNQHYKMLDDLMGKGSYEQMKCKPENRALLRGFKPAYGRTSKQEDKTNKKLTNKSTKK